MKVQDNATPTSVAAAPLELPTVRASGPTSNGVAMVANDESASRAVFTAVAKDDVVALRRFLGAGGRANARDAFGTSLVMQAVYSNATACLELLLCRPGIELLVTNNLGDMATDLAERSTPAIREAGGAAVQKLDLTNGPEHYLVVGFEGIGGGGSVSLRPDPRLSTAVLRPTRKGLKEAKALVQRWMKLDPSQGGPRWQSVVVVGASWGAGESVKLARWFHKRFGFPLRLHAVVEGANLVGLPFRYGFGSRIGPAETTKNYYVSSFGWPRGGKLAKADENVELGDMGHNDGLYTGASKVADEVTSLLQERTGNVAAELRTLRGMTTRG